MKPGQGLLQAIAVTAELTGTEISETAARVMAEELARYPEPWVVAALKRCQRELRSRMTLADVLARLDDGRPGPEEAWALCPRDEYSTVVWTEEMCAASGVARPLIAEGDDVAARMAFLERYRQEVQKAREEARPPRWTASLGWDVQGRETAVLEAVRSGRLTTDYAMAILPPQAFAQTNALPESMRAAIAVLVAKQPAVEPDVTRETPRLTG